MIAVAGTHALARGEQAGADARRRRRVAAVSAGDASPPSYPSPSALLHRHGLRAKKSWGQNFLGDEAILDDIARLAVEREGERVVELGAGLGHLTARLLARGAKVVAVERDRDLAAVLRAELGGRAELLEADAARLDYATLAAGEPLAVVGNLPYHLTSPILFSLLDSAAGRLARRAAPAARGGGAAGGRARAAAPGASSPSCSSTGRR